MRKAHLPASSEKIEAEIVELVPLQPQGLASAGILDTELCWKQLGGQRASSARAGRLWRDKQGVSWKQPWHRPASQIWLTRSARAGSSGREVVEDGEIDEARRGPLFALDASLFRQLV